MSPNRRVVVAVLALALGALACSNPTSRIAERTPEMPKTVAVVTSTYVQPETVAAPATVAPEEAARRWREAVAELDYVAIEALTCSAEQVNFQNDALWISALSQLRRTRTGDELEAEVTDLYFETISIGEDRAAVRVSGPMEAELLSYAHIHAVAETWSMVKEGGRWKWCGSEGRAQVTGTAVGEARLFVEYAKVLGRDEGMREAETLLSSARRINPFDVEYSASLARIYRAWADMTQDAETRDEMMQRSSLNYDIATTLSPANAILWTEWAMLYLCTGQFEKAQDTITHSLEIDPECEQTWTVQGDIYANQYMLDDALAAYETALALDPKKIEVWLRTGDIHREKGRWEDSIAAYEEALGLSPAYGEAWRVVGSVYAQVGRTEPAIDALQRALELAPEASDAWDTHRVLAVLCHQVGQSDLALAHAYEALTRAPEEKRAALQELVTQLQSTLEKDAP